MNRDLFARTKQMLKNHPAGVKLSSKEYLKQLSSRYNFGTWSAGYFSYTILEKIRMIAEVKKELGVDLEFDAYPEAKSRQHNAALNRNEKLNSYSVSRDFILINSINELRMNQQLMVKSPLSSLGLSVKANEIDTVEHPYIVLVENLTLMANLASLILPECLQDALWLYRGDVKPSQTTTTAYDFFRRWQNDRNTKLVCFSDLDPKGIEIAYTSGADYWLSPVDCEAAITINLQGIEQDWHNQSDSRLYLQKQPSLPAQCQLAFTLMNVRHKTLKQEHMLRHGVALQLFDLN